MRKLSQIHYFSTKKLWLFAAVCIAILGLTGVVSYSAVTVKASAVNTGTWGGADWTIDGGALTLSGADIGCPPRLEGDQGLAKALRFAGADPAAVTSITIANRMSARDASWAFANFSNLKSITGLGRLSYSGSAYGMFANDGALTSLDISAFDTANITSMDYMFLFDASLVNLDVSHFDTQNVGSMYAMFDGLINLTSLDVSSFNTSKVNNMGYMFVNAPKLTSLDVSHFDTSNVTNMQGMFDGLSSLTSLDVSSFNTSKVVDMSYLFLGDSKLTSLDVSHFDTSNVMYMQAMFDGLTSLTALDLSSFDTNKAVDMSYMLWGLSKLEVLSLGSAFCFIGDASLPAIQATESYTGKWQNVGAGTMERPSGSLVWTSAELMANYKGGTQSETFVWQGQPASVASISAIKSYESAWPYTSYPFSSYGLAPTKPENPYHYRVIMSNDYPYYTDFVIGASLDSLLVSMADKTGTTVYSRATETMTDSTGASAAYVNISFGDGRWYWINEQALNTEAANTGSVVAVSQQVVSGEWDFPIYYISNSFNATGQIIWSINASAYADQMRAAAAVWNQVLGRTVFVENTGQYTDEQVTLKLKDQSLGADSSVAASYAAGGLLTINTDQLGDLADKDTILIIEHELGHAMGLAHTFNYSGGNFTSDIMTGHIIGSDQAPTANEIQIVKMILANHDFANPHPMNNPYL